MIRREYAINNRDEVHVYETINVMSRRYYQLYKKMEFNPSLTEGKRYKNLSRNRIYIIDEFRHTYNIITPEQFTYQDKNDMGELPTIFRTFDDIVDDIRNI